MEKMMILVYNSAYEKDFLHCIDECGITGYTKISKVFGKGRKGGPRLGTHIWPGENEMMIISADAEKINIMADKVREEKLNKGGKGVKAFILPVEEQI